LALEEPRKDDTRFEIDGLPFAVPPDVRIVLRYYDDAVLDLDPNWGREPQFFVRYGRRSCSC
jgi:hypothetical protein